MTPPTHEEELQDWISTPSKNRSIFEMPEVEVATAVRVSVSPARPSLWILIIEVRQLKSRRESEPVTELESR